MEVKKGYKQTEVGVIPEDWQLKRLREISPSQSVGLVINPSTYFDEKGTIPILVGSQIKENRILWESAKRITVESNQRLPSSRLNAGDLVMVRVGDPGVVSVVPDHLDGCNCASMMIVRQHRSFNSLWLCYVMNSRRGRQQVEDVQYGTAQKQFNISDAINFQYAVPILAEQEAIATALSDADAWIESLEQLIAKKRQIKQGAMQELLTGKRRLPGFSGEWEVKRLGDIGKFLKGSGVTKDQTRSGTLACVRYGELYTLHNDVVRGFQSWISSEVAATAVRLKQGDILFAGSGETKEEIGKCAAFVSDIEAYGGGDIVILRPDDSDSRFLGYYLNTSAIARQKASRGQGDAVVHISSSALSNVRCKLPSRDEQTAIAEVLTEMDAEIAMLETKLTKARQIKQAMMQELLTGRIRLV
jgi:type I restriction enzyme S subunit